METIPAFKEWENVCAALAEGRQSIILRKGGIHEGRAGFSFAQEEFLLFPTRFHGQAEKVREYRVEAKPEWQPGDAIRFTHFAKAIWARTLTDAAAVEALEPFHIWTPETVRERFDWEGKGMATGSIHCALVRIYALDEPWMLEYGKKYGGCRSWVDVPAPPANWKERLTPVLGDDAFSTLAQKVEEVLGLS